MGRQHCSSLYKKIVLIALLALSTASCSKDMSEPSMEGAKVSGPHIMLQASFGAEASSSARTMELLADDIYLDGKDTTYIKRDDNELYHREEGLMLRGFGQAITEAVDGFYSTRLPFAQEGTEKVYFIFLQGEKRFVSESTLHLKATDSEKKKYYAELLPVALPAGLDPSSSEEIIMTGVIGIESIDPSTGYIKVKSPGIFRAGDRIPTLAMYFPAQMIEAKHLTGELPIKANFRFLGGLIMIPMFRELDKRFYPETLDMGFNYEESPFMTEGVIDLLGKDISNEGWTTETTLQGIWGDDMRINGRTYSNLNSRRVYQTSKVHTDSVIYVDSYHPRTLSMANSPKTKVTFDLSPLGEMGRESSTAYNGKTPRYTGSVYAMYVYSRPIHELTRDSAWVYTIPPTGVTDDGLERYPVYPDPAPGNGYWRYFWVASQSGKYKGKPISVYGSYVDNTTTGAARKKFCMLSESGEQSSYYWNDKLNRRVNYGRNYSISWNQSAFSGNAVALGSFNPLYKMGSITIDGNTYDNFYPIRVLRDTTWRPDVPDGWHYTR